MREYAIAVVAAAILSPTVGTFAYQRVWRNLDLTGY
jgi:hypothetical protein